MFLGDKVKFTVDKDSFILHTRKSFCLLLIDLIIRFFKMMKGLYYFYKKRHKNSIFAFN